MNDKLVRLTKSAIWFPLYFFRDIQSLGSKSTKKGSFLVTVDVETANDFIHWMDKKSAVKKAGGNRKIIEKLIQLTKEYQFPLTWFCTGHSLLEECSEHQQRIYCWATVKNGFTENFQSQDWFRFDPQKSFRSYPEWYFGDIFKKLYKSEIGHEIGMHTFGHIRCDLATEDEFIKDMTELSFIFKRNHWQCKSFAFPWNKENYIDELPLFSIETCRLKKGFFPSLIKEPQGNSPTLIYQSFEGRPAYFDVLKYGVDLACKLGLPFVWLLHPEEISTKDSFSIFRRLTDYVLFLKSEGKINIKTMGEFNVKD